MSNTLRDTAQRRAMKDCIAAEPERLWSPQELCAAAAKDVPNIGIATIYRNIKAMVANRDLIAVPLPGQPDRYCQGSFTQPSAIEICTESDRAWGHWNNPRAHLTHIASKTTYIYGKAAANG